MRLHRDFCRNVEKYKSEDNKFKMIGGSGILRKLIERAFCNGVAVGICLYQRAVVAAHEQKKHLKIGDTLYYVQDGRERLAEMLEKICK